jgi:hypothetical protein
MSQADIIEFIKEEPNYEMQDNVNEMKKEMGRMSK